MANRISRRHFLGGLATVSLVSQMPVLGIASQHQRSEPITRPIPGSGEQLPVIGMGTWRTFNVGRDEKLLTQRAQVLKTFFEYQGTVIDSSPMYGTAELALGKALSKLGRDDELFAATKIWTSDTEEGVKQAKESRQLWGVERFDLLQVHNLVNWQAHLETLKTMKERGEVRYIGITTSHGRRLQEFEDIMEREPLDFVQLTYNVLDRWAEERLLPLAQERGIAVIANRPFQGGRLFDRFQGQPLPSWAGDAGCENWAEYFLKFIVSHPAVTCAIPATTQVEHMQENMGAQFGALPDPGQRSEMIRYLEEL
ncbi:aldo/keto reductase [Marinobacter salicampi]|uniref:aldo/keto reductase n=1 Tax=Marinobacter salicampi TaxID=435907 RepID=UPI00140E1815|nr:aldo/keto reductase [Marinobacter salicampi]